MSSEAKSEETGAAANFVETVPPIKDVADTAQESVLTGRLTDRQQTALHAADEIFFNGTPRAKAATMEEMIAIVKAGRVDHLYEEIEKIPFSERCDFVNRFEHKTGMTLLFYSFSDPEDDNCTRLLLDYGSNPLHQDNEHSTPLHYACKYGHKKGVKQLIFLGADACVTHENDMRMRPYQLVPGSENDINEMLNYCNKTVDAYRLAVTNKEVTFCSLVQRSYCRAMFAILDYSQTECIELTAVLPMLASMVKNEVTPLAEEILLRQFFKSVDEDRDGVLKFPEFLAALTGFIEQVEKKRSKGKKKGKGKGKKGKKK